MVKVQIDLSHTENKIVDYYKTTHTLLTKEEAIKRIISQWGKKFLLPEIEKDLKK